VRIIIAGGHGQIALRLEHLLSSRGDEVAGIIRTSEHAQDLVTAGAEPLVCDLESADVADVVRILKSADAAVFAAGAGPGSGIARKETMDHAAAVLFADAAEAAGVRRFLVISSMGADRELTNDPGTGRVTLAESTGYGQISRDDVAAVLAALLTEPGTIGLTLELVDGDTPVAEAVKASAGG
jgi:uncharacterized protein YbjT (DUF2867 family)